MTTKPLPPGPETAPVATTRESRAHPLHVAAALGTGCLLSLMVLCNATVTAHAGPLWGSLAPHATGTVAALLMLAALRRTRAAAEGRSPLWAYGGGLLGAMTVMLSSVAANTALALSGTLALGLLGQAAFGLAADRWGLLGLPRRRASRRDLLAIALILGGSALLIFGAPA
ncbi:DMT family transporter [Rubellimicrobium roseum]|uniref:EamA-like transporter family protein n=1 Tax=Rubellimicrobium roseum TaxID=687525 RepID=A0A5C4NMQ7_9RHOB|nr:DMT family transporter [Rubellimicrobium roseum]TNC74708.1 EamA-like transporter family protein [Rubellimicrobium roseum]